MTNCLYYGDNLTVLRESIATGSIDLVYLDPPFNSQANYNLLFRSPAGVRSQAQIEVFEDTWHWNDSAERAFDEVIQSRNTDAAEMLRAMRSFLKENDVMAYITMMAVRLLELHRVLKATGSLFLHCDPSASHYLKILLDAIFGPHSFQNEIVWKRTSAHSSSKRFGPVHDIILYYAKSDEHIWNPIFQPYDQTYIDAFYTHVDPDGRRWRRSDLTGAGVRHGETGLVWRGIDVSAKGRHWAYPPSHLEVMDGAGRLHWPQKDGGMPMIKRYLDEQAGMPLQDIISDIPPMHNLAAERLGYPTQKPLALLERLIQATSNPGDTVLDPFCGCGTTIHAAQKLGRHWTGIDITHLAISLIEKRLRDAFAGITFDIHGTPKDLEGARALAAQDKYQFQWWAVSLVNAVPFGGKKKGADGGIDGVIYFRSDARTPERAIVSVKGGAVSVPMVRDLKGVLQREKAPIGIFLTLAPPTRPMETEAASAGFYTIRTGDGEGKERQFPRLQIITIEQALNGAQPAIPLIDAGATFKRAAREKADHQAKFDL
ncbi:MAG: DNA methyltransferase [Rhodopila sp.]|jgi:site-specific DNA-methyltransferase (adenine-specific)